MRNDHRKTRGYTWRKGPWNEPPLVLYSALSVLALIVVYGLFMVACLLILAALWGLVW